MMPITKPRRILNNMVLHADLMDISLYEKYLQEKTTLNFNSIYIYVAYTSQFLKMNPDLENIDDYNEFFVKKTPRTHVYHAALRYFIKYKIQDKALREKLIENLVQPVVKESSRVTVYLSEEDRINIINHLQDPKHVIMTFIMNVSGIRFGDILRLEKNAVTMDYIHGQMALKMNIIGKRGRKNPIYIYDEIVIQMFNEWYEKNKNLNERYVFYNWDLIKNVNAKREILSYKCNYKRYTRDLKRAIKLSGLNIDPKHFGAHDFRRSFSRDVWKKYKDPNILQRVLQHRSANTTLLYLRNSGLQNADILYELQTGKKTE